MKVSEHFELHELVHPDLYNHLSIGSRAADFLHPMLTDTLESLKRHLGDIITVNNWHWGGAYKDSGLRLPDGSVGARFSSHRFGTAVDCKFKNYTAIEVQENILANPDKYPHITRMEDAKVTKTWLHIEVGQRKGRIKLFKP